MTLQAKQDSMIRDLNQLFDINKRTFANLYAKIEPSTLEKFLNKEPITVKSFRAIQSAIDEIKEVTKGKINLT